MNPFHDSKADSDDQNEADAYMAELLRQFDESQDTEHNFDRQQLRQLNDHQLREFQTIQRCLEAIDDLRTDEFFSTVLENGTTISTEDGSPNVNLKTAFHHSIGRYRIEKLIGEGGFARVFLANDPVLNRHVALKVPKPEAMASPASRRRFQREAEAAAALAHPAIVPVFESGNIGEILYIAFRYCNGKTLTAIHDHRQLNNLQSAMLAGRIAEAVGHAHDRGIVHRDLKPGNILIVDGEAPIHERLRISDFGLAKFYNTTHLNLTIDGAIIGTPAYMSPEQARGNQEAGPSSDIYSIGVILYELLTGKLPHPSGNLIATLRCIEENNPEPLRAIDPRIPRDLEAICLKCLEKNPKRRYATAYELADDLNRWVDGKNVLARNPNVIERAFKWLGKHMALSAAVFSTFAAVTFGLVLSQYQYQMVLQEKQKALVEKRIADQERKRSDTVVEIMVNAFKDANPSLVGSRRSSALEVLTRTKGQLIDGEVKDVLTRARLLYELSRSFYGQGDYASSIESASEACDIYCMELGPADKKTIYAMRQLAQSLQFAGQFDPSISVLRKALESCEEQLGRLHPLTIQSLNYLGIGYIKNSRNKLAIKTEEDAYQRAQKSLSPTNKTRLSIMRHLAAAYRINGELNKSLELHKASFEAHKKTFGISPMTLKAMLSYAVSLDAGGENDEAVGLLLDALNDVKKTLGVDHPQTLRVMESLIDLMHATERNEQREELARNFIFQTTNRYGEDHPSTTLARMKLSKVWWESGEHDRALELLERTTELLKIQLGESHPKVLAAVKRLETIERTSKTNGR